MKGCGMNTEFKFEILDAPAQELADFILYCNWRGWKPDINNWRTFQRRIAPEVIAASGPLPWARKKRPMDDC